MGIFNGKINPFSSYDDDDDFFDEADESFKAPPLESEAQRKFENTYSASAEAEPEADDEEEDEEVAEGAGLFGSFRRAKAKPGRPSVSGASGQQLILFSPKSIDDCGSLVDYILNSCTVVMTLDSVPNDTARRMFDFSSGIAFALQAKVTPVSDKVKTFFITPQSVGIDRVGAGAQPENTDTF